MNRRNDSEENNDDDNDPDRVDIFLDDIVEFGEKPPKNKKGE